MSERDQGTWNQLTKDQNFVNYCMKYSIRDNSNFEVPKKETFSSFENKSPQKMKDTLKNNMLFERNIKVGNEENLTMSSKKEKINEKQRPHSEIKTKTGVKNNSLKIKNQHMNDQKINIIKDFKREEEGDVVETTEYEMNRGVFTPSARAYDKDQILSDLNKNSDKKRIGSAGYKLYMESNFKKYGEFL